MRAAFMGAREWVRVALRFNTSAAAVFHEALSVASALRAAGRPESLGQAETLSHMPAAAAPGLDQSVAFA